VQTPARSPSAPSPAIPGRDLSPILGVETRGNAEIRCEVCTTQEDNNESLACSVCDRKCRKIARSKSDLAAGYTHRDNLAGS